MYVRSARETRLPRWPRLTVVGVLFPLAGFVLLGLAFADVVPVLWAVLGIQVLVVALMIPARRRMRLFEQQAREQLERAEREAGLRRTAPRSALNEGTAIVLSASFRVVPTI